METTVEFFEPVSPKLCKMDIFQAHMACDFECILGPTLPREIVIPMLIATKL